MSDAHAENAELIRTRLTIWKVILNRLVGELNRTGADTDLTAEFIKKTKIASDQSRVECKMAIDSSKPAREEALRDDASDLGERADVLRDLVLLRQQKHGVA